MKAWICLSITLFCLNSVNAEDLCLNLSDGLETACECPSKLTLISNPKKFQVDSYNCDDVYVKGEWQDQPTVIFPEAEPNKTYTLLFVDPDARSHMKGQFYLHWTVSNIKGEDFLKGDLSKANHLQRYFGPEPSSGSGLHRYMLVAFEEGNNKDIETPIKRTIFELEPWLRKQKDLCGPVAGIQFRTQF